MAKASEDVHSREALQGSGHRPGQREPVHQAGTRQDRRQHAQQPGSSQGGCHYSLIPGSRPPLHVLLGHQQAGEPTPLTARVLSSPHPPPSRGPPGAAVHGVSRSSGDN